MRLFRLHKKIQLTTASLFLLFAGGFTFAEPIGGVIESTGVTSVKREQDRILTDVGTDINMYDEAETANGRMLIQFLDNEKLKVFISFMKFILITINKIKLGIDIAKNYLSKSILKITTISDKISIDLIQRKLDYLINNENDLFTFNLDKKIFMINFITE